MFVLAVFVLLASAVRPFPGVGRAIRGRHVRDANTPEPTVSFYTQQIDHTNFELALKYNTYQQRILQYSGYWGKNQEWKKGTCKGPIFFYTGNESPVTDYYYNSGFLFQLAESYGALVIFAEHRYFGESMPFGNSSFSGSNVQFLSPEQALADYATYLSDINSEDNCPIFSFGGSYGGMLTAWFRMKYPNVIMGGLAASAPIAFYGSGYSEYAYMDAAQDSYRQGGPKCDEKLAEIIQTVLNLTTSAQGLAQLSQVFPTCSPLQSESDGQGFLQWFQNALIYMVELNYNTASDYGIQFPALPLNRTCADLNTKWSLGPLSAAAFAIQNYYNASGDRTCVNMTRDQPDFALSPGWGYLACTETYLPMAQRGMWWPHFPPNLQGDIEACKQQWGVNLRPNWPRIHWGGNVSFEMSSNIIFSNGLVDPWHALGLHAKPPGSQSVAVLIPGAAHHEDLRAPDANDSNHLTLGRQQEAAYLNTWMKQWYDTH